MHKINTDTADENGEFVNGNPSATPPVDPTELNAEWFNSVQRELLAVLDGVGVEPDENDDEQIWDALQKIGIKCLYSDQSTVDVSEFTGATVVFHSPSDFEFSGLLKSRSLIVVVPFWGASTNNSMEVTYNEQVLEIANGYGFIGFAANGFDELQISGIFFPIADDDGVYKLSGLNVTGVLNALAVKSSKRFEMDLVGFDNTDADHRTDWLLASNWSVGQVKRVYCRDVTSAGAYVGVYIDTNGNYVSVKFNPGVFREFLCVGSIQVENVNYAVLLVNGLAS